MASGGRRRGQQGKKYPNRSDMRTTQAPKATTGQTYGEAGKQLEAQRVIPLSRQAAPAPPSIQSAPTPDGGGGPQVVPSLTAPTSRPDEPLTAGLPTGAGPGPESLNLPAQPSDDNNLLATLRGLYQAFPSSDLVRLIAEMQARG